MAGGNDQGFEQRKQIITENMPGEEMNAHMADFFSAFADRTRLKIITALQAAKELCVRDIAGIIGSSESAISHQLKILRLMRLITYRSEGKMAYYRLDDSHIEHILKAGHDHVEEQGNA